MTGRTPEETDALIDEAIRRADASAAANLFEENAIFVLPDSGEVVAGRQAIRETFSELLAEGAPEFEGNIRNVLITGDIALVSRTGA